MLTRWYFILLFGLLTIGAQAQNCRKNSTGLIPLNDLGTGFFNGYQGGLYPAGLNERPADHTTSGVQIAEQVEPLDQNGNVNYSIGKVVFLSIGMSNSREEFGWFQTDALTRTDLNPYLRIVNGAQGGEDIHNLLDPEDDFWAVVEDTLARIGLTTDQVQVIWFKEAEASPDLSVTFPAYAIEVKDEFKIVMNIMKDKYPNAKLCYLSSRIYGDYGVIPLNPEPHAYYNGWSVKFLVEDQLNGDPDLRFEGANPVAPWLSWGPYTWADGINPRSDGLQWLCPIDFKPDGNHPSLIGRAKVADMLMDFFTTDVTAVPWFIGTGSPPPAPPAPPSALAAVVGGRNQIGLTWSDNSNNEQGFKIEPANTLGQFVQIASVGAGAESYSDRNLLPNTLYRYRLRSFNSVGNSPYSNIAQARTLPGLAAVKEDGAKVLSVSNYPNPFNPCTEIEFTITDISEVTVRVYNTLGQEVSVFHPGLMDAGVHKVRFEAGGLAGGVYYYRLQTSMEVRTGRMLLAR